MSAPWVLCECSVNALWRVLECAVKGLWVLFECSVSALWVLCECSVSALWVCQIRAHFGDTVLRSKRCWVAGNRQNWSWIVQQIRATLERPPGCGTTFNKSGRHCKPSDEINLICLMYLDYLDLCVTCATVGQLPSWTYQAWTSCVFQRL